MHTTILMAGDNLHARILVDEMVKAKVAPNLIINEEGTLRASKLSSWLKNDIDTPPSVKTINSQYLEVSRFDEEQSLNLIKEKQTDFLIIAGCGAIIKNNILSLSCPINVHPGLLPQFRGLDPVLWSIDKKQPLGATVHIMDEGIDTGDILISQPMPILKPRSVLEARLQTLRWGGKLLADFLKSPEKYPPKKQTENKASYFSAYPATKMKALEQKLKSYYS